MPSATASSSKASAKPYDRPVNKGKGKAIAPQSSAAQGTNIGAPAQHGQRSRKGKKAWRKNVDITGEEVALEQSREEERATGGKIAEKKNDELFVVDTVGDVQVAQKLRRAPKPLRSLAVLDERSAIPSLSSRSTITTPAAQKKRISSAEKARLRRIARKDIIGSDGTGLGSAEVKTTTPVAKDAWKAEQPTVIPKGGFGEEAMVKRIPKAPVTLARQREIYLASQVEGKRGLELPDQGTSYNPTAESHSRLIEKAVEEEKETLRREEEELERMRMLGEAVHARKQFIAGEEFAPGMQVGPGEEEEEEDQEEGDEVIKPKMKGRKTQAQRNKARRSKELARLAKLEATQRKLVRSIGGVSEVKATLEKQMKMMAEAERMAKIAKKERERLGLEGGEKIGKFRLDKGRVTVQLGEDLAESLRQVKPEGNLFKDRFLALQKKALVEPRVPVLPKRKSIRTKEYEKHAYKRFT